MHAGRIRTQWTRAAPARFHSSGPPEAPSPLGTPCPPGTPRPPGPGTPRPPGIGSGEMEDAPRVANSANFALAFIERTGHCRIRSLSRLSSGHHPCTGTERDRERPLSGQRFNGTTTFAEKVTRAEHDSICEPEYDPSRPGSRARDRTKGVGLAALSFADPDPHARPGPLGHVDTEGVGFEPTSPFGRWFSRRSRGYPLQFRIVPSCSVNCSPTTLYGGNP